jgi:hypothetical protein
MLGWTETYARVSGGVFTGSGTGTAAMLIPVDLWLEKGFYLGKILTLVTALGPTIQISNVTVATPIPGWAPLPEDLHLSATTYGAAARLGLEFYLGPDWGLRPEFFGRFPITTATYSEGDNKTIPTELQQRSDHLATFGINLGVNKVF